MVRPHERNGERLHEGKRRNRRGSIKNGGRVRLIGHIGWSEREATWGKEEEEGGRGQMKGSCMRGREGEAT